MSQQQQQQVDWKKLLAVGPYPIEAFAFVREGFDYAVERVSGQQGSPSPEERHITGQQLCLGLRESAIENYGLLAPAVLEHWNIQRTYDFGRIVFALIEEGLMTKTPSDSIEDFQAVYDFDEAFSEEALLAHLGAR